MKTYITNETAVAELMRVRQALTPHKSDQLNNAYHEGRLCYTNNVHQGILAAAFTGRADDLCVKAFREECGLTPVNLNSYETYDPSVGVGRAIVADLSTTSKLEERWMDDHMFADFSVMYLIGEIGEEELLEQISYVIPPPEPAIMPTPILTPVTEPMGSDNTQQILELESEIDVLKELFLQATQGEAEVIKKYDGLRKSHDTMLYSVQKAHETIGSVLSPAIETRFVEQSRH